MGLVKRRLMNKTVNLILIPIIILLYGGFAWGQPTRTRLEKLQSLDSESLLLKGEDWLSHPEGADSALMYFSVVASRYAPSASYAEKENAVKAYKGKWLVYFSYLYDYPKAYESIMEALSICEQEQLDDSDARISLAGMLQVMGDQGSSAELYRESLGAYSEGLREAVQRGKGDLADRAFVNMATVSHSLGERDTMVSLWKVYNRLPVSASTPRRRMARALYEAYMGESADDYASASENLEKESAGLPDQSEYSRLRFIGMKAAADMAVEAGLFEKAYTLAREAREYASGQGLRDGLIEATLLVAQVEENLGRQQESTASYDAYLRLKEKMTGGRLIQRLDEIRFMADMEKADKNLALLKEEKKRQTWVIVLLSVLVGVIAGGVWLVIRKNRKLSEAYRSLLRQFELGIAGEERERKLRQQLEEDTRYKGSSLSEGEKERILASALNIVGDPDVVCTADFSLAKMAEMVGCNAKYLSQVINDEFGCNFNMFINKYRISEAARRLNDTGEWSRLTIEGIANSVGFRSRSTFVSMFKQFTGTTPSEYRRRGNT